MKYRSKSKVKEMGALDLAALVVEQVAPYLGQMVDPACRDRHPGPPRLLVVTAKTELKEPLRAALLPYTDSGKLAATVAVEHFGGRNRSRPEDPHEIDPLRDGDRQAVKNVIYAPCAGA